MRNKVLISNPEELGFKIILDADVHMYKLTIVLNSCDFNKHNGVYQIVAKNKGGEAFCSTQINIKRNFLLTKNE